MLGREMLEREMEKRMLEREMGKEMGRGKGKRLCVLGRQGDSIPPRHDSLPIRERTSVGGGRRQYLYMVTWSPYFFIEYN